MNDTAAFVAQSRARCGLPPKVIDRSALRRLAFLLNAVSDVAPARARATASTTSTTDAATASGGRRHDTT